MSEKLAKTIVAVFTAVSISEVKDQCEIDADATAAFTAPVSVSQDSTPPLAKAGQENEYFVVQDLPDTGWYPKGPIADYARFTPTTLTDRDDRYEVKETPGGPVAKKIPAKRPKERSRATRQSSSAVRKSSAEKVVKKPPVAEKVVSRPEVIQYGRVEQPLIINRPILHHSQKVIYEPIDVGPTIQSGPAHYQPNTIFQNSWGPPQSSWGAFQGRCFGST